jgi:hypothetical protein
MEKLMKAQRSVSVKRKTERERERSIDKKRKTG